MYEFDNHRSKDFPLFTERSHFTDDTILTIATADTLMQNQWDFAGKYREYGKKYPSSYDTSTSVEELQKTYEYNETCQRTVPEAFRCFWEATDFEDAIRNAISIGGDSDTAAVIAGSMAEAKWGVPESIRNEALGRLDRELLDTYERFVLRVAD